MSIYLRALEQRADPPRSLWGRLTRGPNPAGFATELGNKLRALSPGQTLDPATLAAIQLRFNIVRPEQSRGEVLRLLARVCSKLTPADVREHTGDTLRNLGKALSIPAEKVEAMLADAGERVFRDAVAAALADDELTEREHDDLEALAKVARLADPVAGSILADAIRERLGKEVKDALADGEISPEEEAALDSLAKRLRTELSFSSRTADAIAEAKRLWQINRGPLTPVESPLLLRKGETAYAVYDAETLETRTRTTSYRYAGPSFRVRIMKGVSYRVGSASVSRNTQEYSHSFGSGVVVLTDKRVLFRAAEKTININYPKIVDYELYRDGIKIYKETGKPLTIVIPRNDNAFGLLFARLISA